MNEHRLAYLVVIAVLAACVMALITLHTQERGHLEQECRAIGGDLQCVDMYGNNFTDLLQLAPPIAGAASSPPKTPPPGMKP